MKNTNKKAKTKKTIEELAEIKEVENNFAQMVVEKRKLLKIIRSTASFASKYKDNALCAIKIRVKEDSLTLWATDGNRAIETSIEVCNDGGIKEIEIVVFAHLLTGLCFNVSHGDFLNIKIDKSSISFEDPANRTFYKLGVCDFNYPDVEKVMNDSSQYGEDEYKIAFNRNYMENMKRLLVDERTNIIEATFNKANNLKPILFTVKNHSEAIEQRTVLMPIQIR